MSNRGKYPRTQKNKDLLRKKQLEFYSKLGRMSLEIGSDMRKFKEPLVKFKERNRIKEIEEQFERGVENPFWGDNTISDTESY
jgi:hypothetical protein